ncbi:TetR/AcrR family transcriptional regulator [Enterovibrio paralichthyis]|uniref:TetR/AcrR family transcriptional regulator n=1 Tax=Enterovibrio paralichthyis TaxID=2853805 RepID=UPI001C44255C|nr:TetR/AcrR family transcriptional regulator [Enterovibrio paralichthyis]MBV7298380.1 TetR/AcrR family transcriptional regulator [Enterovibrio paralichthyis]
MPKRSKEDTEVTIRLILDAVVDQLVTLGYDKMSYTTLSQQTGISRTGISHHFPKKTDFITRLDDRLLSILIDRLDLEGDKRSFIESWLTALRSDNRFTAVLRLFFLQTVSSENAVEFTSHASRKLHDVCCDRYGDDFEKDLEWLLGKSILTMA